MRPSDRRTTHILGASYLPRTAVLVSFVVDCEQHCCFSLRTNGFLFRVVFFSMRERLSVTIYITVRLSIIINILSIRPTEWFSISNRVSSSIFVLFGTMNFSLDRCTSSVIPHSVSAWRGRCVVQPASIFRFRFYDRQWLVFTKVHRYFYFIDKNEWVSMLCI